MSDTKLDITALENWLWGAACKIRGDVDAPKYKDCILPHILLKRISDVFEDEVLDLYADYSGGDVAETRKETVYQRNCKCGYVGLEHMKALFELFKSILHNIVIGRIRVDRPEVEK